MTNKLGFIHYLCAGIIAFILKDIIFYIGLFKSANSIVDLAIYTIFYMLISFIMYEIVNRKNIKTETKY